MRAVSILTVSLALVLAACADSSANNDDAGVRAKQPAASSGQAPTTANESAMRVPGLEVEVVTEGTGQRAKRGNVATVHYVGRFPGGEVFDSSRKREEPLEFRIGRGEVIKGWDMTAAKMRVGDRWIVTIPPQFAYGSRGAGGVIPPNATLEFDMELLGVR